MNPLPENDLFLLCLGAWDADQKAARLKSASPEEWQALLRQALKHHLLPVLFWHLKPFLDDRVQAPAGVAQHLQNSYLTGTGKNLLLFYRLERMLKALQEAEIPVILLKGAHLANFVYPDFALRQMVDIDFLVHRDDLFRSAELFFDMGYQPSTDQRLDGVPDLSHQLPYFTKDGYPIVELHWTLVDPEFPLEINLDELWSRAQPVEFSGLPALTLSSEDLLLHLILHVAYPHNFNLGLKPFYDIAITIGHYQESIDWQKLFACATQWGIFKGVYLALLLTTQFFNPPIPPAVLESMRPADLSPQMVDMVRKYVLDYQPQISPNLAEWFESKSLLDRLKRLVGRVFFPPRVMAVEYNLPENSPRVYLYYPVRLFDVIRENGKAALRLARGDPQALSAARRQSDVAALRKWMAS